MVLKKEQQTIKQKIKEKDWRENSPHNCTKTQMKPIANSCAQEGLTVSIHLQNYTILLILKDL